MINLWQILLKAQAQQDVDLTCEECVAILNYLADQAIDGVGSDDIWQAAYRHLARCEDCYESYQDWLRQWEAK